MNESYTTEAMRRLGIRHPIIQGPFGGGLSTARLAATVSNLGGLGSYGAHSLPPDEILETAREIRALTTAPFALNLWVSDHDDGGLDPDDAEFERVSQIFAPYFRELGVELPACPERFNQRFDEQVAAVLEANPPVFSFVFGVPSNAIVSECRRRGIVTIGAATTIAESRVLEEAGVDLVVASGSDAGGHRPSFLRSAEDSLTGTFSLVSLIADRARIPVIAAGGIVDARGVCAALALGAHAAQIGTAFLACEESGATAEHREILFGDRAQETLLTRAFSGRLARGVPNRWTDEMAPRLAELPPFPIQSWFVSKLRPAAVKAGRTDLVSLWSGQAAPNLRHRTASSLMDALINPPKEIRR